MKINEIFESLQGEGKYCGYPCLFIRLSGCTRACSFCDTTYHNKGKEYSVDEIINIIKEKKFYRVVWTGGEPGLYQNEISEVIYVLSKSSNFIHQIETNGDIFWNRTDLLNYICFSPKSKTALLNILAYKNQIKCDYDIKVVTDLKMNKDLIYGATILMPLSTFNQKKDLEIQQKVWNYCVKNKIRYTPRIHKDVWGVRKGI